jgi:hypothetical protein
MLAALAALLAAWPAALAGAFGGALAAGDFVFTSSFFSHRVEGTLATTSLARTL